VYVSTAAAAEEVEKEEVGKELNLTEEMDGASCCLWRSSVRRAAPDPRAGRGGREVTSIAALRGRESCRTDAELVTGGAEEEEEEEEEEVEEE
jgi:hypothetical protein